ncbi:MAG: hypothetical protein LBB85_03985, partial [Dysgonamonadaceae bacterium]|nr:hypothetical protein [Dysgonamonadaceae bacterium]
PALFSCTSEAVDYGMDKYYVEIVTALDNDAFLLDTGPTIRDSNKTAGRSFASGDRVYLSFSYGQSPSDPITVHGAAKIFSDTLKTMPENTLSQQKTDPVRLESAWIGNRYLNLIFYMEYRSKTHKLALWVNENQVKDREIDLYFSHDKNNDTPGYPVALYASYDLSKVLGEPQGDRTLSVHFNTTNYGNKICTLKY